MTDPLATIVLVLVAIAIIFSPSFLAAVKTHRREKRDTKEAKQKTVTAMQAEEAFEILLKNHKNRIILENYHKSPQLDVPEEQKPSVVGEQKQSSGPNILSVSEIISRKSITIEGASKVIPITNALQGQTKVDRKNIPTSESQIESRQLGVIKGPEIINQKKIPISRKTRESSEPSAVKGRGNPKQKNVLTIGESKQSPVPDVSRELDKISSTEVRQKETPQSDFIQELETNLTIATMPWANKPLPFQTSCWDSNHAESEPLLTSHIQDLLQLYVDIGLANNIVWMATEFGHRSKELDESYIRLCTSIAERIKKITSLIDVIV